MGEPEFLLQQALLPQIDRHSAAEYCLEAGIASGEFWNRMALRIAEEFHCGSFSYKEGDHAMNRIWGQMIEDAAKFGDGFELPEPAFSIYEAFDAGEYTRRDDGGEDPVIKYTQPLISEILSSRNSQD